MGPIPGMDSLSDNVKIFMQREAAVKAANERHQEISKEPVQINEQAFYFEFHFEPIIENPFTTLPPRDAVLTFT